MNVPLTGEAVRIVSEEIAAGEFQSAAEVKEALLAFEGRDDRKERERIDALVDEAAGSEASEMTAAAWGEIRRHASAMAKRKPAWTSAMAKVVARSPAKARSHRPHLLMI